MARITGTGVGGGMHPIDPSDGADPTQGAADAQQGAEATAPSRGGPGEAFAARQIPQESGDTALQAHAKYFDLDGDGMISRSETDEAMRMLGLAGISSKPTSFVINAGLGRATSGRLLDVSVENIHLGMHGGDTGVFDKDGNFQQEKFDALWPRFDKDGDGALNQAEIDGLIAFNNERDGGVYTDAVAARGEFYLLLDLAGQPNAAGERVLTRERMQSFYDGDLFPQIAAERAAAAEAAGGDPLHGDVNAGLPGLARNFGGIFAGSAAGAKAGELLTRGEEALSALTSPLTGAMRAVCPGLM